MRSEELLKRKGVELQNVSTELSSLRTHIDREFNTDVSTSNLRQAVEHLEQTVKYIGSQLREVEEFREQSKEDNDSYL